MEDVSCDLVKSIESNTSLKNARCVIKFLASRGVTSARASLLLPKDLDFGTYMRKHMAKTLREEGWSDTDCRFLFDEASKYFSSQEPRDIAMKESEGMRMRFSLASRETPVLRPPVCGVMDPMSLNPTEYGRECLEWAYANRYIANDTCVGSTPALSRERASIAALDPVQIECAIQEASGAPARADIDSPTQRVKRVKRSQTQSQPSTHVEDVDPAGDPMKKANAECLRVALLFQNHSHVFRACARQGLSDPARDSMILRGIGNRVTSAAGKLQVARFMEQYRSYAGSAVPVLPVAGSDSVVTVTQWLLSLHERGATVPRSGLYALRVFKDALEIEVNITAASVLASIKTPSARRVKRAPMVPTELLLAMEKLASETKSRQPFGKRVFASAFVFQCYASARYADTVQLLRLKESDDSFYGEYGTLKNTDRKTNEIRNWAIPKSGVNSTAWLEPYLRFREAYRKSYKAYPTFVYPEVKGTAWSYYSVVAPYHLVAARLRMLFRELGFPECKCTPNSPRNYMNSVANQLHWPREDREVLGRWAAGSKMPVVYDRTACATEIRLRNGVLAQIRAGWRPAGAFQIPSAPDGVDEQHGRSLGFKFEDKQVITYRYEPAPASDREDADTSDMESSEGTPTASDELFNYHVLNGDDAPMPAWAKKKTPRGDRARAPDAAASLSDYV